MASRWRSFQPDADPQWRSSPAIDTAIARAPRIGTRTSGQSANAGSTLHVKASNACQTSDATNAARKTRLGCGAFARDVGRAAFRGGTSMQRQPFLDNSVRGTEQKNARPPAVESPH